MSKYLLYFVVAMSADGTVLYLCLPAAADVQYSGRIIIGALYLSFVRYAGVAACESYSDRFSRLNGMEFGQIRMWGSLGWAVASSFSGLLFNLSPAYNFILGSVASIIMLIVLVSLKVNTNSAHASEVLTKEKSPCGCLCPAA